MRYKLKIQIGNNEPNFGKGVVELLELCDKYGSLSKAYNCLLYTSDAADE